MQSGQTTTSRCAASPSTSGAPAWRVATSLAAEPPADPFPASPRPWSACTPPTPRRRTCRCGRVCRASPWTISTASSIERRSVVKHLAMRRTLWVVRADDLRADSARRQRPGRRQRAAPTRRRRPEGRRGAGRRRWLDRACAAVLRYLAENGPASASRDARGAAGAARELRPRAREAMGRRNALSAKGIHGACRCAATSCADPTTAAWTVSRPRWATSQTGWRGPDAMPADKARAELVRRWLRASGRPRSGHQVVVRHNADRRRARRCTISARSRSTSTAPPGSCCPTIWTPSRMSSRGARLLPGLDVTTMGWADRDWYLGAHRASVFDPNGNAGPTAWWNGRIVGGWYQDADGRVRGATARGSRPRWPSRHCERRAD